MQTSVLPDVCVTISYFFLAHLCQLLRDTPDLLTNRVLPHSIHLRNLFLRISFREIQSVQILVFLRQLCQFLIKKFPLRIRFFRCHLRKLSGVNIGILILRLYKAVHRKVPVLLRLFARMLCLPFLNRLLLPGFQLWPAVLNVVVDLSVIEGIQGLDPDLCFAAFGDNRYRASLNLYTYLSLSLVGVFLNNIFCLRFWSGDSETRHRQAYPPTYP